MVQVFPLFLWSKAVCRVIVEKRSNQIMATGALLYRIFNRKRVKACLDDDPISNRLNQQWHRRYVSCWVCCHGDTA
jgi:hypothetical protein